MEKRSVLQTIIVLGILIIIALLSIIFYLINRPVLSPTVIITVPRIETTLPSETEGPQIFGTHVHLEVTRGVTFDQAEIETVLNSVISGLTYEQISSAEGMAIIREGIRERIAPDFADGDLVGIYLTNVLAGFRMPEQQGESPLDALFRGIRDVRN